MKNNFDIIPPEQWCKCTRPLIIAGPCSVESEKQVLDTAFQLKKIPGVSIFRSGLWKPRTHPGTFEGIKDKGFPWLKKVKEETGFLVAVEVGHPDHIRAALENNIDILWIGARTIVSPFVMNDIANILKDRDIPVLIKNPVYPDIELWIGAIERINNAGVKKIIAIHRGFHSYEKSCLRNNPLWEIPIELKRRYPNLPLICDPSHISGNREYIESISQQALDLGMEGLMIEVHTKPEFALTDKHQQITPIKLGEILNKIRTHKINPQFHNHPDLDKLRKEIEQVDFEILDLLAKRFDLVESIAKIKRKHKLSIFQVKKWEETLNRWVIKGETMGMDQNFIKNLIQQVHKESIRRQSNFPENTKE